MLYDNCCWCHALRICRCDNSLWKADGNTPPHLALWSIEGVGTTREPHSDVFWSLLPNQLPTPFSRRQHATAIRRSWRPSRSRASQLLPTPVQPAQPNRPTALRHAKPAIGHLATWPVWLPPAARVLGFGTTPIRMTGRRIKGRRALRSTRGATPISDARDRRVALPLYRILRHYSIS